MTETLSADYLVVGSGAMGLAFVDTLLTSTLDKTVILVDRYPRPGGHWILAYPYVRLHQPAAHYGVNSRHLGTGKIDEVGWNKGIPELSSRDEILNYYDLLLRETFLPSGRVRYFPKHEYNGERRFESILTGKVYEVTPDTTIVDATYSDTKVPSMRPPEYSVAKDVSLITPNDLPSIKRGYGNYTVVGAGKTGIDAILWLVDNKIPYSDITWIMPRDPLFYKRNKMEDFAAASLKANESIMAAKCVDDVWRGQVEAGQLMVFDEDIAPTVWHCPTISKLEYEALRKIENIIRKGRVVSISADEVTLTKGSYTPEKDALYIDCSATAIRKRAPVRIFQDKHITLQPVRLCQQTFSAAVIAHVESAYAPDEELKNYLCTPIPMPNTPADAALTQLQTNTNALRWAQHPKTQQFVSGSRLDLFGALIKPPEDPEKAAAFFKEVLGGMQAVTEKLRELIEQEPEPEASRLRVELQSFSLPAKV